MWLNSLELPSPHVASSSRLAVSRLRASASYSSSSKCGSPPPLLGLKHCLVSAFKNYVEAVKPTSPLFYTLHRRI